MPGCLRHCLKTGGVDKKMMVLNHFTGGFHMISMKKLERYGVFSSTLNWFIFLYLCNQLKSKLEKNMRYNIPQVPHKAVAEVSKIGYHRRGEFLCCMDGRANPLMDRKVVGVVFFGAVAMIAVVTSPTTAGCSVAYCSCRCSEVEL